MDQVNPTLKAPLDQWDVPVQTPGLKHKKLWTTVFTEESDQDQQQQEEQQEEEGDQRPEGVQEEEGLEQISVETVRCCWERQEAEAEGIIRKDKAEEPEGEAEETELARVARKIYTADFEEKPQEQQQWEHRSIEHTNSNSYEVGA